MFSNMQQYDLAIIGAGFSGSMVAVHITRLAPHYRLLIIDRAAGFGQGVAYGTKDTHHLLNVPAGKMSAFPEEPDHFVAWIAVHTADFPEFTSEQLSGATFVPRCVYGQYVREIFERTQKESGRIATTETEIVDIEPTGGQLLLLSKSGEKFLASKTVLALGNFGPGDPPTKDRRFHRSPRYLNMPWSPGMFEQLSGEDDIVVLGSGLTALDLLVSLDERKARGKIHVVSRHGLFPQPHREHLPQPGWFKNREV